MRCSVPLNLGLAVCMGRIISPPKLGPRSFFQDAPGAPTNKLLRAPQLHLAGLSVPSNSSPRLFFRDAQVPPPASCFMPRAQNFDLAAHLKSTSRKLMVKLDTRTRSSPKHRNAARKATTTEAARDDREYEQTAFHHRNAGHHPEENCHCPLCPHRYTICLILSLAVREKIICRTQFVHLHISEPMPGPSRTQSQTNLQAEQVRQSKLPLFCLYYSQRQQLKGMIPTKNSLAIKQYIRDKPVRWGIKSFLLCVRPRHS